MALACSLYSTSPSNPRLEARASKLDIGKPMVIVFLLIPTVLVLAFSRAATWADGLVVTVEGAVLFPELVDTPYATPPIAMTTTPTSPRRIPRDRRWNLLHDLLRPRVPCA